MADQSGRPSASDRWMRGAKKKAQRAVLQNKIRKAERKLNRATDELNRGMSQFGRGVTESAQMAVDFADSLVPPRSYIPGDPRARAAANRPLPSNSPPNRWGVSAAANRPVGGQPLPPPPYPRTQLPYRILQPGEMMGGYPSMRPQQHQPQAPIPHIEGGGYSIPVPWQR